MMKRYELLIPSSPEILSPSLRQALKQAVIECPGDRNEEEGGFLVSLGDAIEFHRITNQHTGTPTATGFYEPDREEYGHKVITSYARGARNFGSFHTHPTGCRALPSLTDLQRLFNGQPNNFIWSPSCNELLWYRYGYEDEHRVEWVINDLDVEEIIHKNE